MTDRRQPDFPFMKPIEYGRPFSPEYGQALPSIEVQTSDWQHRASARFGPGRLCGLGTTRWTGDSYRYDIFESRDLQRMALRWWNGGGEGWLISDNRDRRGEPNLLSHIATLQDEPQRWDFCHFLWQAAHKSALAGTQSGRRHYAEAFLEGRLKKRRRRGTITVEVLPKMTQITQPHAHTCEHDH